MLKTICDICKTNEAHKKFKVKHYIRPWRRANGRWERIDICTECYNKLMSIKEEKH